MTRRALCIGLALCMLVLACPFDTSLREYLDARFWLPFTKEAIHFEPRNVRRIDEPFAGMTNENPETPLGKLRAAYQGISMADGESFDPASIRVALSAARADRSLTPREREEVDLIDAKIDLRLGGPNDEGSLRSARDKLEKFLRNARTPEFRSEARGWLGRAYHLMGNQTAAGKIYLDELNHNGSNLSRETLLTSLKITYGLDGGQELREHLADYFDTPEHAAFAIELTTNPRWDAYRDATDQQRADEQAAKEYARIRILLEKHADLFRPHDPSQLTLLMMRTALRMGDPAEAVHLAQLLPRGSDVYRQPDFLWMVASAHFLTHDYPTAEAPLLALFRSSRATRLQRHAAAYGLCGVYSKTGDRVEQIRYALWLRRAPLTSEQSDIDNAEASTGEKYGYTSVYWDGSGWDLNLLLEAEASIKDLQAFLSKYPYVRDNRLIRYALAVRLARDNRYNESASVYQSIYASRRAARMRRLAILYAESQTNDLSPDESQQARLNLAKYIGANEDRVYFNDALWNGLQRYALTPEEDARFTRQERETATQQKRQLKDDQEERWRAYLILRDVVRDAGRSQLGRRSALVALDDLTRISDRFGRQDDIRAAIRDLRRFLLEP